MTSDLTSPSACNASRCPAMQILRTLLDKVESIEQTINSGQPASGKKFKKTVKRPHVDWLILGIQIRYPHKQDWTADELAKKIGCSVSAVRQAQAWKEYQEKLAAQRQKAPRRRGYKDKRGNLVVVAREERDVFDDEG